MTWRKILVLPVLLLPAAARAEEAAAAPAKVEKSIMDLFEAGGVMMPVLALLSVGTVLMILLYFMMLRRNAVVSDRFMNSAEALIRRNDFLGLIGYCHRRNECMARITQRAVEFMTKNTGATFAEVREVAEAEGSRQASLLTTRVSYLADIGAIAPMIGLLGTVIGLIKSFLHVSDGGFQGARQMAFAGGISEALIATAAGLGIGLPALVFYAIFRGKVQKLISELEAAATHLMAILRSQVDRHTPPAIGYGHGQGYSQGYGQGAPAGRQREGYLAPGSLLPEDRPDLHGI